MRSEGSTTDDELTRFDGPLAAIEMLETLESLSEWALRSKVKRASSNRSSTFVVCGVFLATPRSWWKALLARSSFGDDEKPRMRVTKPKEDEDEDEETLISTSFETAMPPSLEKEVGKNVGQDWHIASASSAALPVRVIAAVVNFMLLGLAVFS